MENAPQRVLGEIGNVLTRCRYVGHLSTTDTRVHVALRAIAQNAILNKVTVHIRVDLVRMLPARRVATRPVALNATIRRALKE